MKIAFVFAAATALLAQGAFAEKCVYATVAPELHSLARPMTDCMEATENTYDLARSKVAPTAEQSAVICTKCKDFVKAVNALPPWPSCTLDVGGKNQTLTDYFGTMLGSCASGNLVRPSNSSSTLTAAAPAAPTAVTEKCVYSTVAPELHSLARPMTDCMVATENTYDLARSTVAPTAEQSAAICSKCKDFVKAVNALPPWPSCHLNVGGKNQTLTDYFGNLLGSCASGNLRTASTSSSVSSSATSAPVPQSAASSTSVGVLAASTAMVAATLALTL